MHRGPLRPTPLERKKKKKRGGGEKKEQNYIYIYCSLLNLVRARVAQTPPIPQKLKSQLLKPLILASLCTVELCLQPR